MESRKHVDVRIVCREACGCQNSVNGVQGQDGKQKTDHRSMKEQDGQQNSWNDSKKSLKDKSGQEDGQQGSSNDNCQNS